MQFYANCSVKYAGLPAFVTFIVRTLNLNKMYLLRLLTKICFILNICFLITVILRFVPHLPQTDIIALIILAGYVLAMAANVVLIAWLGIFSVLKRSFADFIPKWLLISNFLLFVSELIFFFY